MGSFSSNRSMTTIYHVIKRHHQTYVSEAKFTNCDRVTSRVGCWWPSNLSTMKTPRWGFTCRWITLTLMSLERGLFKQVKVNTQPEFLTNRAFCVHLLYRSRPFWHTALRIHRHFWKFSDRIMHKMSTQFSNYYLKYHTKSWYIELGSSST